MGQFGLEFDLEFGLKLALSRSKTFGRADDSGSWGGEVHIEMYVLCEARILGLAGGLVRARTAISSTVSALNTYLQGSFLGISYG